MSISMLYTANIYSLANFAMDYRGRNMEEKRAFFLDPIFDIFNEENTKVMIFPYYIKAIMNDFPEVRDTAPKGCTRDIMYACEEEESIPDTSVFFNQKYYNRLYANDVSVKEISIDGTKPGSYCVYIDGEIKEISDENPLKWILNEYEGYPIYLDVSETGCGPCRVALKDSESLRKHFRDSDIKFIIIWLRSEKETWFKIAPTLTNAIQIFIDSAEMDDKIQHCLGVKSFPTYLMIDRYGNIINKGVPRYLSPELLIYLSNYL